MEDTGRQTHIKNVCATRIARSIIHILLLFILYGAISAAVMDRFMTENGHINQNRGGGFDKYLQHQVQRPFAYRVLLPLIVGAIEPIITSNLTESMKYKLTTGTPLREYMKVGQNESISLSMSVRYHIGYFISFASLIGLAFALRALAFSITPDDTNLADFAPVAFVLLLPLTFLHGGFLYDFPELLFLALSFLMVIKNNVPTLCLILPIAILNKETNILIPLLYATYFWKKIPADTFIKQMLILISVAITSLIIGRYLAPDTGGKVVMDHLSQNMQFIANPESWFLWFRAYGGLIPFPRGYNVFILSVLLLTVMVAWKFAQPGLRRSFVAMFIINLYLVLSYGNRDEIRNWSLIFIPLYLIYIEYFTVKNMENKRTDNNSHNNPIDTN